MGDTISKITGFVTYYVTGRSTTPLEDPWRKLENRYRSVDLYHGGLMEEITKLKDIKCTNILLVGPIGAGKSAFINSISTIDKNRIAQPVVAGGAGDSVTKKLQVFEPKERLKLNKGQYRLQDTMGIERFTDSGFYVQDIVPLMNGNIKPNFEFNTRPLQETDENYRANPTLEDQIHCVALVIDANMFVDINQIPEQLRENLLSLIRLVRTHGVPMVMVLTKIDTILPKLPISDISEIYRNAQIKLVVDNANELFGVQKMDIFPVMNYCNEVDLNLLMDILLLLALRKMLHFAIDHVEHVHDQMEPVHDQREHAYDAHNQFARRDGNETQLKSFGN